MTVFRLCSSIVPFPKGGVGKWKSESRCVISQQALNRAWLASDPEKAWIRCANTPGGRVCVSETAVRGSFGQQSQDRRSGAASQHSSGIALVSYLTILVQRACALLGVLELAYVP